jgi:hypothetical protein
MSDEIETRLAQALLAQRALLQSTESSAALDERFEQSLASWKAHQVRAVGLRRLSRTLAAAAMVVLVVSTGWLVVHVGAQRPGVIVDKPAYADAARHDTALLRVRASLGAQLPDRSDTGFPVRQRHYWVDVAVAGDGTLYIERVTPVDEDPQSFVP